MKTRMIKDGDDVLVRIPAEIAFADADTELEVTRTGDVVTIRPAGEPRNMREAVALLRSLPVPEVIEEVDR